jgi:integrase
MSKLGAPFKDARGKWRIRWTDEKGKRHGRNFDSYADAAFAFRQRQAEVEEIKRGLRAPEVEPRTFDELCDHYLKYYTAEKRSPQTDLTNIGRHLRPHFGKLKLYEIGESQLAEYRMARRHLSPQTLRKHLVLLGTMLRVAEGNNWLKRLPKIKKPKLVLLDKNFRYLRTDEEIARLLLAARQEEDAMIYYFFASMVYTGLRAGEGAGLRRDDIDLTRNLITVRRSYEGLTKNGETRHVPILGVLRPVLVEWLCRNPGSIVFPNQHGTMLGPSARIFQEVFHRVLGRAGFPKEEKDGKVRRYMRFHDLRHTFASHFMMKGGDLWKLKKILGHKSIAMTERYSHLSPTAFGEDYNRFGLVAPGSTGDNLVSLRAQQ